jgi:ADP-ribose pyrophosphatase YjhB (NUDIX family)
VESSKVVFVLSGNEKWHRHLGAYGICLWEDKLLVIQKGNGPYIGRYDLPGGTVEANESLVEAVKREFIEETGMTIGRIKNLGVCDFLIPYKLSKRGTTHIHHIAMIYLVQNISGILLNNPEKFEGQDSLGAVWVPLHEINYDNASPLVIEAKEWVKTKQLTCELQRLDEWVILGIDER